MSTILDPLDANGLYTDALKYYNGSTEPFMLYAAGEKILVVVDPHFADQVFKDVDSYSTDPMFDVIYRGVANVSKEGHKTLWRKPSEGFVSLHPNPKEKVLVHTGYDLLHKQILQPQPGQDLTERVMSYIEQRMRWDAFFDATILAQNPEVKVVSLHSWCRDVLIEAQSRAFFGDYLRELEPMMTTVFDDWDFNSWMMVYQVPGIMAKRAIVPRDRLIKVFKRYLESPREIRAGGVPFVNELEDEERQAGLSAEDSARILMIILWGINSNVQMTTFWMMAHILSRPMLANALRKETAPAMGSVDSCKDISGRFLADMVKDKLLERCPLLNSVFDETLRVSSTGSSVRQTMRPVHLAGKYLPEGIKILLPVRQLLFSTEVFGPTASQFDFSRFMNDKSLVRKSHFRTYGGGTSLCTGRFLGKREVLTFVAYALWRYDTTVVGPGEEVLGVKGKAFPRVDEAKPSLGVSKQIEGDDIIVKLTRHRE
ncbi:MAG: hypothetical protein Q9201_001605 [Fulgogasparrea decipioides]